MVKQRRLADLYVIGKEYTVDDGRGGITVWLQKMNLTEMELTRRKADAARARVLALRSQPDSDTYLAAAGDAFESTDVEYLVGQLLLPEAAKRRQVRESEVAFADEWSKDNYLQGLRDAWLDHLSDTFVTDPNDPEANRVFDELKRYQAAVDSRMEADLVDEREELMSLEVEELQRRLAEENLKNAADMAWMAEFQRCTVWYGVRTLEKRTRYFDARSDVDELQKETFLELERALQALAVDPLEGKDSAETPSSSASSEALGEVETALPSGPVAVGQ